MLLLPVFTQAQKKLTPIRNSTTVSTNTQFNAQIALNCTAALPQQACNMIVNNTFQGINQPWTFGDDNSIGNGWVPGWVNENGSPNVYDGLNFFPSIYQPPYPGFGFGFFGSLVTRDPFGTVPSTNTMEGLSQKIPPTIAGHKYVLSFYRRCQDIFDPRDPLNVPPPGFQGYDNASSFKIYLTTCSYHNSHNTDLFLPTVPAPAQAVYCETNVLFNGPWERIMVTFTADNAYTLFYANTLLNIQPYTNTYTETGILLSYPELIDLTAVQATIPAPTVSNCNATLTAPACAPVNTQLVWHGPAGQSIATAPAQTTTVSITDAANIGTWTLSVTAADAVNTNTTCGTFGNGGINFPVVVSGVLECPTVNSIAGMWSWMKGDNIEDQQGIYGTKGVFTNLNKPGARHYAASWKDNDGNFWLFGGTNRLLVGGIEYYNDLWKYNVSTNQWAWISGNNVPNQIPQYGSQGIPSISNTPGARSSSTTWVDLNGNLWLFGGQKLISNIDEDYNDLWKFDVITNQWTWVKGDNVPNQFGVYGTRGISSSNNKPPSKEAAVGWRDSNGIFWLFGGTGYAADVWPTGMNDLWKYNPLNNEWTWINGENSGANNFGIYGSQGISSPLNIPGTRYFPASWSDNSGNLWLFGGNGLASSNSGYLNDLWKFNINTQQWTWVSGSNISGQSGVYGIKGTFANSNSPGARWLPVYWTDLSGNFWLFGGDGYASSNTYGNAMNDLWKYDKNINQWAWVDGSNNSFLVLATYGTQGIATPTTNPGGRWGGVSWIDNTGNLWQFGGRSWNYNSINNGGHELNDMWKYNRSGVCPTCRSFENNSFKYESPGEISFQTKIKQYTDSQKGIFSCIYNAAGQLIRKGINEQQLLELRRSNNIFKLKSGLYFVRSVYQNGDIKSISIFVQ